MSRLPSVRRPVSSDQGKHHGQVGGSKFSVDIIIYIYLIYYIIAYILRACPLYSLGVLCEPVCPELVISQYRNCYNYIINEHEVIIYLHLRLSWKEEIWQIA